MIVKVHTETYTVNLKGKKIENVPILLTWKKKEIHWSIDVYHTSEFSYRKLATSISYKK